MSSTLVFIFSAILAGLSVYALFQGGMLIIYGVLLLVAATSVYMIATEIKKLGY